MSHATQPLNYLMPAWYAVVMGLAGLALAWHRATPLMGELAGAIAVVVGGLAAVVFAVLAVTTLLRVWRHPQAWTEDCRHPVRHTFIAALPISVILLATVAVALQGPSQPALFIPVVGNVLVPLAGVPLDQAEWAAAQFGIGLMFWPVVMILIVVRIAQQGLWPERLLPASFIFVAPPADSGLAALQFGAPLAVAWALWGMALFTLLWVGTLGTRIAALPFGLPHWGMSFPLAPMAALTLRLATPDSLLALLGPALLALASLLVVALLPGTLRGLRVGNLLAREPVATITPAAA